MPLTGSVKGLPEATRELAVVFDTANDAGVEAMRLALLEVAKEWAARVPVLDGNYQRAMSQENAVKAKPGRKGAVGYVNVPHVKGLKTKEQPKLYAARLEFGSAHTSPQPSARPGLDAAAPRLSAIVGHEVGGRVATKRRR